MKILKFTLSGKQAMFKRPDVNTYYYFTYGQIHKPALLGIFGAILGYQGFNQMKETAAYPEYYEKLQDIKVSICPNAPKGYFNKKIVSFNNSVGYASKEQGGNLIVKEQWLEAPSWDIYLSVEHEEAQKLGEALLNRKCEYIPYLGKNDHAADIYDVNELTGEAVSQAQRLDCLFPKKQAEIDADDWDTEKPFKYEESLPVSLDEITNLYKMEKFVYTNMPLLKLKDTAYRAEEKIIVFY